MTPELSGRLSQWLPGCGLGECSVIDCDRTVDDNVIDTDRVSEGIFVISEIFDVIRVENYYVGPLTGSQMPPLIEPE